MQVFGDEVKVFLLEPAIEFVEEFDLRGVGIAGHCVKLCRWSSLKILGEFSSPLELRSLYTRIYTHPHLPYYAYTRLCGRELNVLRCAEVGGSAGSTLSKAWSKLLVR